MDTFQHALAHILEGFWLSWQSDFHRKSLSAHCEGNGRIWWRILDFG